MTSTITYANPIIILSYCNIYLYCFTDLDNMDINPFISQHETHIIIDDTRQSSDEDNQENIEKDIYNGIIRFEVEAQQEIGQDWPWEQTPIQCTNNGIGDFVIGKI